MSWQSEYKCLSELPSATCSSFPAIISQAAYYFHARQYSRHAAKQVKQFLEAKNIEIMKWPGQSPDLNPTEILSEKNGDKVMAKKPTTVTGLWNRVEEMCTKITPTHCERFVISCGCRCAEVTQSKGLYTKMILHIFLYLLSFPSYLTVASDGQLPL